MEEIIKLNCPSCGSSAPHNKDSQDFLCEFCGTRYHVKKTGEDFQFMPFIESIQSLKTGMDRTGFEMTIRRLKDEIAELNSQLNPLMPEYQRLKGTFDNPGLAVKFRKYWWIGFVLGFILFIVGITADLFEVSLFGFLLFLFSIIMYALAAKKAIKMKLLTNRYQQLRAQVIPLQETIERKRQLIQSHQESIDQ